MLPIVCKHIVSKCYHYVTNDSEFCPRMKELSIKDVYRFFFSRLLLGPQKNEYKANKNELKLTKIHFFTLGCL
jgi:hypothetical protein